jgi:hypothetical protein
MPVGQLNNVSGAGGETLSSGPQIQDVVNTSATAIPVGTLVAVATPIVGPTPSVFGVAASSTVATTAPLDIGIAIGGAGQGSSIAANNGAGQVVIQGFVRALVDSSVSPTVVGHRLIRSATVAGAMADAGVTTGAAGLNYGVILEAVTISSGTQMVNVWFQR